MRLAVFTWFMQEREKGTPITGDVIVENMLQIWVASMTNLLQVLAGWIHGKPGMEFEE